MNRAKYGSNENFDDADARSASTTSLTSFFQGVKRGFQFSTYETKLQDALQEETLALENFSIVLYQEVSNEINVCCAISNCNCAMCSSYVFLNLFIFAPGVKSKLLLQGHLGRNGKSGKFPVATGWTQSV